MADKAMVDRMRKMTEQLGAEMLEAGLHVSLFDYCSVCSLPWPCDGWINMPDEQKESQQIVYRRREAEDIEEQKARFDGDQKDT